MIGIMAVLAILAAILLPPLIKQVDKTVADQEKSALKSLADAFQQSVLNKRVIPDQTTWYSAVASQLGLGTNDVLYNVRQQSHAITNSRVFLIDPALQVGLSSAPSGLPYSQTNFISSTPGSPMSPQRPRLMLVSSLGNVLPNVVASGVFGDTTTHPYFADLWNAADGTVPTDTAWSGWTGKPGDVLVQRINLAPMFVHLLIGKYNSAGAGGYAIDGTSPIPLTNVDGFFIQGSVLTLCSGPSPGTPETQQILTRAASFILENGVWRGSLSGSSLNAGIMNIGDLVQQFLLAPPNVNAQNPAGNAQQILVISNMLSYMSNYNVWAQSYNFSNAALKTYLGGIQGGMMSTIQGLYSSPANFPANPSPCLQ
jgi:type II secretory pathway pseudopilin PulG